MSVCSTLVWTLCAALRVATPQHDPFSIRTTAVEHGSLVETWSSVRQQLHSDQEFVQACARSPYGNCATALELLRIVGEAGQWLGKTRIGHINRAINLAIKPSSGAWKSGLEALGLAEGNCTAYAVAKYLALREAGISPDSLRLVIVRNQRKRQDHIVVAVRSDDQWLILDNATMVLRQDAEASDYTPIFVLDESGVRRYGALPA